MVALFLPENEQHTKLDSAMFAVRNVQKKKFAA
jgi:hypothetical protein